MKSFISSQFGYCSLVWMFHSRKLNHRINRIHERALRIVYSDYVSSFDELLLKDNSVNIHTRNIQNLAIELYKVVNKLSPPIMNKIFILKDSLNHSSRKIFQTSNIRTSAYGLESLRHIGPKIWDMIPKELKDLESLKVFTDNVKQWTPSNCPCKLCKSYIKNVGYL